MAWHDSFHNMKKKPQPKPGPVKQDAKKKDKQK